MPNFSDHAPKGYMGDPRRGAALGRPYIGPDTRSLAELEADFADACKRQSDALRLKEARPSDGFKASAWEAAAASYAQEREEIRQLVKALKARQTYAPKVTLRRVRLDSGGYDECGAYWGIDLPLYWAATDDGEYDETFRATGRENAKAHVRERFPLARFYN